MKYAVKYGIDFAALAFFYVFVFFRKWKKQGRDVLFANTLMYIYLSFVLYFTLMPVLTSLPFILNHPYRPMNMTPFPDIFLGRGDAFRQVLLNVIMTVPFGFLLPLTGKRTAGFGKTVLLCFLMSLGIEVLQPLISGSRCSDITDVITNVTGGILGYGFYRIFRPIPLWILNRMKQDK